VIDPGFFDESYFMDGFKSNYGRPGFKPYNESQISRGFETAFFVRAFLGKAFVLDLCCARGAWAHGFLSFGMPVIGIDLSSWATRNCFPSMRSRILRGSISHLPLRQGLFSFILAIDALEHVPEPYLDLALDEIRRVSSSSARLLLQVPVKDNGVDKSHVSIFHPNFWNDAFQSRGWILLVSSLVIQLDGIEAYHALYARRV
jgi:SAM-dependent methyltransferase